MDSCLRTTLFDNGKIRGDIGKFSWEEANREELLILREKYNLDKIVDNATTQFDKILSLMNWVYNLWPHHPSNQPPSQDALTILSGIEKGERYYNLLEVRGVNSFGCHTPTSKLEIFFPETFDGSKGV